MLDYIDLHSETCYTSPFSDVCFNYWNLNRVQLASIRTCINTVISQAERYSYREKVQKGWQGCGREQKLYMSQSTINIQINQCLLSFVLQKHNELKTCL